MTYLDPVPALIIELRESAGDGTDWTEDLFLRAADGLEDLQDELAGTQREWGETLGILGEVTSELLTLRRLLSDNVN